MKACAAVIVALILCLILGKNSKDVSTLLSIAVCAMLFMSVLTFLEPIIDLIASLEQMGDLNSEMIRIIIKAVGIGLLGEITADVCVDSGLSALGKTLRILAATVILWLSVPLFRSLIALLQEILITI